MTPNPARAIRSGPTVRDLLNARSHALSLREYPDYPPNPAQLAKNKALANVAAYLDELIVARLVRRDNERE